jgi:glutamate 5-kinase
MASKLQSAKRLSQQGVTTHILQLTDNALLALHQNQHIGTTVLGAVTKPTTTKRWLVSGTQGDVGVQTKGVVVANPCLAERLQNADAVVSILPIGLLAVHGVFDKNDLVFVQNEAGQNLAIGRVRYNAATLKSYLGQAKQPIFMHHDYLARIDNYHV